MLPSLSLTSIFVFIFVIYCKLFIWSFIHIWLERKLIIENCKTFWWDPPEKLFSEFHRNWILVSYCYHVQILIVVCSVADFLPEQLQELVKHLFLVCLHLHFPLIGMYRAQQHLRRSSDVFLQHSGAYFLSLFISLEKWPKKSPWKFCAHETLCEPFRKDEKSQEKDFVTAAVVCVPLIHAAMNNSKNRSLPRGAFVNINIPTDPSENKVANSVLFAIEILW